MSNRPALIEIPELVRMLSARADSVVASLYGVKPKGGRVMLHDVTGGEGGNVSVVLNARTKAGMLPGSWTDFRSGTGGDVLSLVAHAKYGGNMGDAIKWARQFLGIDERDPAKLAKEREKATRLARKQEREAAEAEAKRSQSARHMFFHLAQADILNTPVDDYLLHDRGIDVRKLPSTGSCRFMPDCVHYATGEIHPAMLLCIVREGKMVATHRTYLEQVDGHYRVIREADKKGRMKALRLALGPLWGGHVSVSKGKADCPLTRAPQGDACLFAEGYVTACFYAIASPDLRCVSTISLGNMAAVIVPRTVTTRYLVKENGMGPEAEESFAKAVKAHREQCDDVRIVDTPQIVGLDGKVISDIADLTKKPRTKV